MSSSSEIQAIRLATPEDSEAIEQIYRQVQIRPELFREIAASPNEETPALQFVRTHGGFINPPDEKDMRLCLQHGVTWVFERDSVIAGYNRVVTGSNQVHELICSEFLIEPSLRTFSPDNFTDWSGTEKRNAHKKLRRIHWVDRQEALLAFRASIAGLDGRNGGRLIWAIDAAILPAYRKQGIAGKLVRETNKLQQDKFGFRAFRMFEILAINGHELTLANQPSRMTFISENCRLFACTDEDIAIGSGVSLRVRWHHWLRYLRNRAG